MKKKLFAILLALNMLLSICFTADLATLGLDLVESSAKTIDISSEIDCSAFVAGDIVEYGKFEQDNDTANGKEPIEWLVLEVNDDSLLLISLYGLFPHEYHYENVTYKYTTWETSTLRAKLNDDFYYNAFTSSERRFISLNKIVNKNNSEFGTAGGNDTDDYVYLLSHDEVQTYFPTTASRKLYPTEYARVKMLETIYAPKYSLQNGICLWWLRTPGKFRCNAEYVQFTGDRSTYGSDVGHNNIAVRPVLRLQRDAILQADSVALDKNSLTVNLLDSASLSASITPAGFNSPVRWTSSNTKVATVDASGKLTLVGLGTANITCSSGGLSDSCALTVKPGFSFTAIGGSVRVVEPYGLRFGMKLLKDNAYNKSKASIVSYGTLIIPKATLGDSELTIATNNVLNIRASNLMTNSSSELTFTGVLTDIPTNRFDREIVGRGYLIYKDANEQQHTVYTDEIIRTYSYVANSAYQRYSVIENPSASELEILGKLESIVNAAE